MKQTSHSIQQHDLYRKYHGQDSEIRDLLGEYGLNWKQNMINKTAVLITSACLAGQATNAQETSSGWLHAAASMGQYEGQYSGPDDAYGIDYACGPGYSSVGFCAKGLHLDAGESIISVDGTELASGNTTYNSKWDATSFSARFESNWSDDLKDRHNALLNALSMGREMTWVTPSDEIFKMSLTGSYDIASCLVD